MPALAAWRAMGTVLLSGMIAAGAVDCGGIRVPAPTPPPRARSSVDAAPAPAVRCFGPGARRAVLTTSDGVRLSAALLGAGPRGLVLIHHADGDMCQWVRFARRWASDGYHVVAFDLRCHGFSDCRPGEDYVADTAAAVDALRGAGATRVVLVGGSLGASVALVAGARLADRVAGVVALSADSLTAPAAGGDGPRTPAQARATFRAPLLMVYTQQDAAAMPAAGAASFLRDAPSTDKHLVVRAGTAHGYRLLNTGGDIPVLVDAFLAGHTS
jgi:pimeloyl-ACP methyl ester carboxylesterase